MYLSSLLNRSAEDSLIIYLELIPTQLYFAGFTLYHRDISMLMLILNSSKKSFSICFWKQLMRKLLTVSQIVSIAGYVYHKSKGLQKKKLFPAYLNDFRRKIPSTSTWFLKQLLCVYLFRFLAGCHSSQSFKLPQLLPTLPAKFSKFSEKL